ncbi:hypothetical protein [Morganella morganii]|uniref:hypothetical protein n=1 Tax=Morganella morganii TaxID=582 RepID=UPI00331523C9|nr:hypothetical protein [Morganella morganii]HCR4005167.1 hypothetical protein [Morganella morganii]
MSMRIVITITEAEPGNMVAGVSTERHNAGVSDNERLITGKIRDKVNEYIANEFKATADTFNPHKDNSHVH